MKRFAFKIIPVKGQPFEIVKYGTSQIEVYEATMRQYAPMALDIIPLSDRPRIEAQKALKGV